MAYNDSLIQITEDTLIIKDYYFPMVDKKIALEDIEKISVWQPTLFNGKYRLWGMALGQVWLAMDFSRPARDAIFAISLNNTWLKPGFTVANSEAVVNGLRAKNVVVEIERQ